MGHVIIVGSRSTAEFAAIQKAIANELKDNNISIVGEEPSMFINRHFEREEMEYHRTRTLDLFDMEELLRDRKPLKIKHRIKKDHAYKAGPNKLGRGRR